MMTPEEKQEVQQVAQQAAQAAAQAAASQAASQAAQQVAEQVAQTVSQAVQKMLQSTGAATVGTAVSGAQTTGQSTREELGDIGGTEVIEASLAHQNHINMLNSKRTYDEYQHESLEGIRQNRRYAEKFLSDAAQHDNAKQNIANQALQNAVENANFLSKQALNNMALGVDRTWNVDEVSTLTAKSGVQADQVQAIVMAVLAEMAKVKAAAAAA
jgi:hypothetical protein